MHWRLNLKHAMHLQCLNEIRIVFGLCMWQCSFFFVYPTTNIVKSASVFYFMPVLVYIIKLNFFSSSFVLISFKQLTFHFVWKCTSFFNFNGSMMRNSANPKYSDILFFQISNENTKKNVNVWKQFPWSNFNFS